MAKKGNVDWLEIEIQADAQQASQELNKLVKEIDAMSDALRNFDGSKMIKDLTEISKATNAIKTSSINKQLNGMASAMNNYQKASGKSASTTRAYASGFNNLNRSVGNVSGFLNRVNEKINSYTSRARKASKVTENFAQKVGLLYARFFLLIRGVKSLASMVKSSMDYIEVMNYFDTSFGQIAKDSVKGWSEAGYDSAQAYYDSFKERAKKVTADMSGFTTDSNGLLSTTGMKNLGMNPSELIQYQTQFAQISHSMGTTSEQALMLSEVLTKIGADLASVRNMDFNDVWQDMTSGLVGMSRTWDKYGANIRNASMQAKLHELGINATVSSLSQADKALLRTIILLDASKGAWSDLARTINTPANQMRILANNVKLLGQMIGQILLPVVAKILPYLNAFVIVLQRLFTWLARILHIDLSGLMADSGGADNSYMSDLLDDADDLGDSLAKDDKKAKKLKNTIMGFDELNVLNSNDDDDKDSGVGKLGNLASGLLNDAFLDAVNDYLKAWQDAFDSLEDRAKEIADKIQTFFVNLVAPIRRAWEKLSDYVKTSWGNAFTEIGKLLESLRISFWRVWGEADTQRIFEHIFGILGDIGQIFANLAQKFREAWDENLNGYHILAGIRDIILTIVEHFHGLSTAVRDWTAQLNFSPLLEKLGGFIEALNTAIDGLLDIMLDFIETVLLPLGKWVLEEGLPNLLQVLTDFLNKIDWEKLKKNFHELWEHLEPFAERVGEGLIKFIKELTDHVADFINGKTFENLIKLFEKFIDTITADDISNLLWAIVNAFVAFKLAVGAFKITKGMMDAISFMKDLGSTLGTLGGAIKNTKAFSSTFGKLGESIQKTMFSMGGTGVDGFAGILEFLNADLAGIATSGSWATIGTAVGTALIGGLTASIAGFWAGKKLGSFLFPEDESFYEDFTWFEEGGFFDSLKYFCTEMIPEVFSEAGNSIKEWATNTKDDLKTWASETQQSFTDWKENVALKITEWADSVKEKVEIAKQHFAEWKESTKEIIRTWYDEHVAPVFNPEKWSQMYAVVKDKLLEKWQEFKQWWSTNGVAVWFKEHVAPAFDKEKWATTYNTVKTELSTKWSEAIDDWKKKYNDWWNNSVVDKFKQSRWATALEGMKKAFQEAFQGAKDTVVQKMQEMYESVLGWIDKLTEKVSALLSKIKEAKNAESGSFFNFSFGSSISKFNIPTFKFANGGFPEDGFFYANHNELVGGFSNGKTAVANNEQITTGIRNAVYDAMMSVMSTSGGFGGGDVIVNAVLKTEDDEVLARAVTRGQQSLERRYSPVY